MRERGRSDRQVSPYELTTKMMAAAEAAGAKVVIGTCAGVQLSGDDAAEGTVPQLTGITLESGEVRPCLRACCGGALVLCAACVCTSCRLAPLKVPVCEVAAVLCCAVLSLCWAGLVSLGIETS